MPRVSIVLLNWNGGELLRQAFAAARAQAGCEVELVLVDNGSTDGSLEACLAAGEPDRLVRLERNLGFAAGMNAGVSVATGEWIMPLGYDVVLAPDYAATCLAEAERDPEVGVVAGAEYGLVDGERTATPRRSAGALGLTPEWRGRWEPSDVPVRAFGVSGSMPLMRRAMVEDVVALDGHLYDARFGTGYEDLDLWFRMQHRGWTALYVPAARAWHVGSHSAGGATGFLDKSPEYQRRLFRNRRLVWMKNATPGLRRRCGLRWHVFEALLPFYLLLRAPRSLGPWAAGRRDARRLAAEMAEVRARLSRDARVPEEAILRHIR